MAATTAEAEELWSTARIACELLMMPRSEIDIEGRGENAAMHPRRKRTISSCVIQQNLCPFEWVVVVCETLSFCCLFLVLVFVWIGTIRLCAPWIIRSMASTKLNKLNQS